MSDFRSVGISGSLTRLVDGTSYIKAGANTTITSQSAGSVTIASTNTTYSAGTGLNLDGTTFSINDAITATISGSTFDGVTKHKLGLSGSLTRLVDGTPYLIAGANTTITSASNGAVTIATTGGAANAFSIFAVAGQSNVIADSGTDTLTFVGAGGMTITTNAGSDTITFTSADTGITELSQDETPALGGQLVTGDHKISYATGSNTSEIDFTYNGGGNFTAIASVKSIDMFLDSNGGDSGQKFRIFNNLQPASSYAGGTNTDGNAIFMVREEGNVFARGYITASLGFSGSLTQLNDGTSYLIAGSNVTITSASNGAVTIASSGGGAVTLDQAYDQGGSGAGAVITIDNQPVQLKVAGASNTALAITGSVIIGSGSNGFLPDFPGPDTNFFVSGSIGSKGTSTKGTATFGGDVTISGSTTINTVTVTSDGKIGIGTTNPSYKLEVGGNASFGEKLIHRGDTDTYIQFAEDSIGFTAGNEQLFTIAESGQDIVTVGDGGDVDFKVRTEGDDNSLFVQGNSGHVGIGTNNPAKTLHIHSGSPTVRIQRTNNSQNSTIEFVGQAGATANMVHLGSTNDLVFSTHDGTDQEEILRLGGHFGSDNRQVILLSGSGMHIGAMQPKNASDINFFVSGSMMSRGSANKGTAVFGGDLVISGGVYTGRITSLEDNNSYLDIAQNNVEISAAQSVKIQHKQGEPNIGSDVSFFVSGSIDSLGTSVKGSSVFGGDVLASGSISSKTGLSGSLTRLTNGKTYLVAGSNIAITSSSNGQVSIATTGLQTTLQHYSEFSSAPSASPRVTGTDSVAIGENSLAAGNNQFVAGQNLTGSAGYAASPRSNDTIFGITNKIYGFGNSASILGGYLNTISGSYRATIGGGFNNQIKGHTRESYLLNSARTSLDNVIGGGAGNTITIRNDETGCWYQTIGGGANNTISGSIGSTIGGGHFNKIGDLEGNFYSFIGGGYSNRIGDASNDSHYSAILGGRNNYAKGTDSYLIGTHLTSSIAGYVHIGFGEDSGRADTGKIVLSGSEVISKGIVQVGNLYISPATVPAITSSGDLGVFAVGDITLDAAGDNIYFKDNGNSRLMFSIGNSSPGVYATGDLILDASSDITLDAGGDQIFFKDSSTTRFTFNLDSTPELDVEGDFKIDATGNITLDAASNNIIFADNGNELARFKTVGSTPGTGSLGIGTVTPVSPLHILGNTSTHYNGTDGKQGIVYVRNVDTALENTDAMVNLEQTDSSIGSSNYWISFKIGSTLVGSINSEVAYSTFTGQHLGILSGSEPSPGSILVSTGKVVYRKGVSNAWVETAVSSASSQKSVVGVFDSLFNDETYISHLSGSQCVYNAIGEGQVLVTDLGGDIEVGDFICSSNRSGHGMKQTSDSLKNYTVAKANESINWADESIDSELGFKSKLIACTFHCG